MVVRICKFRMVQSVTVILERQRLCLLGAVRGHRADTARDLGKADGMGGRMSREARDFYSEDTCMVCWKGAVLST